MLGADVRQVLREKGIHYLHHANTVSTSCTFLQEGGLASRGYVEHWGLEQTPQSSDNDDKRYDVWHDVFVDTVDIHERASKYNVYGPVLFSLPAGVLSELPDDSSIRVTKKNPIYWRRNDLQSDRFFPGIGEVRDGLEKGTFGHMILIRTEDWILPFTGQVTILLDDPHGRLSNGADAYTWAHDRLKKAAQAGGVDVLIRKRLCRPSCKCPDLYSSADLDFYFG